MSTIDEVLAAAEVVDAVCVIDGETRIISVPAEYKELGVESDEKVTRVKFQCPKNVGDNIDLTEYNLYINYRNAGNKLNSYLVEDVTVTGDTINFSWLLSRHVTESPGTINYIVCAKKSDDTGVINEWNTKVATGIVGIGLEATEEIEEQNIDAIEQILRSIVELENKVDSGGIGGSTIAIDETLTKSGQAADAAAVGNRLSALSEEKVDKSVLGLIVGADGKIYVAINGVAIGNGVEITGGTVEDTKYKVELSDGIILNTLMFQDEFDGVALSSIWKYQIGQNEAAMNCAFSALSENIAVEDGKLRMTVLKNNPTSDYPYSGARIMSQTFGGADNYGFDTGYAEIKFMLDNPVPGVTPAFWTVGQSQSEVITPTGDYTATRVIHGRSWPWAGEIDILEGYGDDNGSYFSPGIIYQTDPYTDTKQTGKTNTRNDYAANEWHTVGLYKSKDALKFYYDRVLVATLDISNNPCFSGVGIKIILNLATGSIWGTIPDNFQQCNMYVDYVRVYSLSNNMTTLADQNTESLLPDCANGFACVANRSWLLRPQFAENTKNTALYWESDNTAIAKVENGYVTTVANGVCNINAKDSDGNIIINFALTVKDNAGVLATKIIITSNITTIEAGGVADISANIYPENCDELTPTVTVITGSEYCSIDGLTVTNINSSGEDKSVVVRVGTNNSDVYEDISLTMATGVSYEVSITDGLTNNFQPKQEYITIGTHNLVWKDSIAAKEFLYGNSTSVFDGTKIVKSNTLDLYNPNDRKTVLENAAEGTFISVLSKIAVNSGWGYVNSVDDVANGTKTGHFSGVYFNSASNARCRLMPEDGNFAAVWQANIGFTSEELLVIVGKIYNGNIEYSLYNASGKIGTTGSKSIAEVVNASGEIGGVYLGQNLRGNGIKGNIHQHLVYNRALTDEEISTIASELISLHSGNV